MWFDSTTPQRTYTERSKGNPAWSNPRVAEKSDWVWKLKKGLYTLVQAGRTWNAELHLHMVSVGLAAVPKDFTVYVRGNWDQEDLW